MTRVAVPVVGNATAPARASGRADRGADRETPMPRFPIMLVILLCSVPVLLAMYIASTRFSDFRHHTFDILSGSLIGLFGAGAGWRWYGAWCCAGGDGRVYGLDRGLKRRDSAARRPAEDEEKAVGTEEELEPMAKAPRVNSSADRVGQAV